MVRLTSDVVLFSIVAFTILDIENRLLFGEVKAYKNGANFGGPPCTITGKECVYQVLFSYGTNSTPAPRRPLPVCIQCRLQTTPSLCQPRSSRRASLSSQQLRSTGFFCGRPCDMKLVTRQYERPGHQQRLLQTFTEDVFIFSLLVYIAH